MAKVSFSSLKLKTKDDVVKIQIADKEIEVKKYLSTKEKNELIEVTLQAAAQGTVFNSLLMDAYFHTYIVIMYTNISFTDTQKEDILKLYDILEQNGVIAEVLTVLGEENEYKDLRDYLLDMTDYLSRYMISAKAIADDLLQYAPNKSEELAKSLENFDIDKLKNVMDIVQKIS